MRRRKSSPYDLLLAVLFTVAGGPLVMAALARHWNPNEMEAGVEGSLTAVALCPIFSLLHGLSYKDTIKLCVPVLGVEYVACRAVGAPVFAILGIAMLLIGFLGFLVSLRARAPRRSHPRVGDEGRAELHEPLLEQGYE